MAELSKEEMRDIIVRAHALATGNYVQSDTEMRKRIGELLSKAVMTDDVMRGFLGYGGPQADCDILRNNSLVSNTESK